MKKDKKEEPLMLEGEIWKPIFGYEGIYEVSNMGRVKRTLKYVDGRVKSFIMKQRNCDGYLRINLYNSNGRMSFMVHRLVYATFIGGIPYISTQIYGRDRLVINHRNEIKNDNRLENLELVTIEENNNYGSKNARCSQAHAIKIYQYTLDGKIVNIWEGGAMECHRKLGYNQSRIWACCHGKSKTYHGFKWSYNLL